MRLGTLIGIVSKVSKMDLSMRFLQGDKRDTYQIIGHVNFTSNKTWITIWSSFLKVTDFVASMSMLKFGGNYQSKYTTYTIQNQDR